MNNKIREELLSLSKEKYGYFQNNLCPGIDNNGSKNSKS